METGEKVLEGEERPRRRVKRRRAFWKRRAFWIALISIVFAILLVLWLIANTGVHHGEAD